MKLRFSLLIAVLFFGLNLPANAQRRSVSKRARPATVEKPRAVKAFVIDQRLAVLRKSPSLYAAPVQRLSLGREINVGETKDADGVKFVKVNLSAKTAGWVQTDAVATARDGDDQRLASLIQGSDGFDKIERAAIFLDLFPRSMLRPSILLLFGDLIEDEAVRLSARATRNLDRREMAASGAPMHSFYLNYSFLDRYRKLGVVFLFNSRTRMFHYDGASWREILKNFKGSNEEIEAQERLNSLKEKLEK
ncbi:MAG: SH3 domain-containing protein [Pyrinomonadaceae bacterium]|nr:SH3 domain-containing protein [Pyrinomonadaceae bacterium]